jgi:Tol biopolymer transport system component
MPVGRLAMATMTSTALVLAVAGLVGRSATSSGSAKRQSAPPVVVDAETAFIRQDWKRAADAYGDLTRREPANGRAWYRLGLSLSRLKRYREADSAIERALEAEFVGQNVFYNAAAVQAQLADTEKALASLSRAVALGYDQPEQLEQDEDLAAIRKDARFSAVVALAKRNAARRIGEPAWSPDGRRIVYSSNENGKDDIFVVDPDGAHESELAREFDYAGMASWAGDGSRILFSAGAPFSAAGGTRDVYVMSSDGSHQAALTHGPGSNHYARVSPDGRRIVFNSDRDGHREIYVANADGSDPRRLTHTDAHSDYPGWSPDGTSIIFESNRDGSWETFRMNADGSGQTRLTGVGMDTSAPRVSPDGTKIAFHSTRNGSFDVYVMNADGSRATRLTKEPGFDGVPDWSPDGNRIVFVSNRNGLREIYTMNADGKDLACVTCGRRRTQRDGPGRTSER